MSIWVTGKMCGPECKVLTWKEGPQAWREPGVPESVTFQKGKVPRVTLGRPWSLSISRL